jgi:DNA repair protein RadC
MIFRGGLDESTFDLKVILREALMSGANVIAVAHNHPSGEAEPSQKDNEVTSDLYDVCQKLDLTLLDHIIAAGRSYFSYRESGFL